MARGEISFVIRKIKANLELGALSLDPNPVISRDALVAAWERVLQ